MHAYTFEYINQKFLLILVGISLAVFIGLIASMSYLIPVIGKNAGFVLVLAVPFLIFWLTKGKLKKQCTATLSSTWVTFDFGDHVDTIEFRDLRSYKVQHYNGTTLILKCDNRKDVKLVANGNFCDSTQMEVFCAAFEEEIKSSNSTGLSDVSRMNSIFEQKWMPFFLIIMTAAVVWVMASSYLSGKGIPTSIYTSIAIFTGMWVAYFKAKNEKQNRNL